jgi:hypothetical protein
MAEGADHILVGRVTGVDMVDGRGRPVTDEGARTGPGLDNTIRLLITADEVLVTSAEKGMEAINQVRPERGRSAMPFFMPVRSRMADAGIAKKK